ncbi:hypothetical protein DIPPA_35466, partial [Diplonema papillatum]
MSSAKSIRAWQLIETIAVLTQLVSGAGDQLMAVLAPLLTEWTAVHPYFYDQPRFVTVFCSSEDGMFNFPWAVLEKGLCAFSAVFGLLPHGCPQSRALADEVASSVGALVRMLQEVRTYLLQLPESQFVPFVDRIWTLAYKLLGSLAPFMGQNALQLFVLPSNAFTASLSVQHTFWHFCTQIARVLHQTQLADFLSNLRAQTTSFFENLPTLKKAEVSGLARALTTFLSGVLSSSCSLSAKDQCLGFLCSALKWPAASDHAVRVLQTRIPPAGSAPRASWLSVLRCCLQHVRQQAASLQSMKLAASVYLLLARCHEASSILCATGFSQEVVQNLNLLLATTAGPRQPALVLSVLKSGKLEQPKSKSAEASRKRKAGATSSGQPDPEAAKVAEETARFAVAERHMATEHYAEAVKVLTEMLASNPSHKLALRSRGECLLRFCDLDRAIADLQAGGAAEGVIRAAEHRRLRYRDFPHELFGIGERADQAAVLKAYRRLASWWHPDKPRGDKAFMILINAAKDKL